jgi:hypothetical protein
MNLWIEQPDRDAVVLDDQKSQTLTRADGKLHLVVDGIGPEAVKKVSWQLDGGPLESLEHASGNDWQVPLARLDAKRGVRTVRVVVQTDESQPQEFSREGMFEYRALPPTVTWQAPESEISLTAEPQLRLKARAESKAVPPADVVVEFTHLAGDKTVATESLTGAAAVDFDREVTLVQGANTFRLVAKNKDAADGDEVTMAVRVVQYSKKPDVPPTLTLAIISGAGERQPLGSGLGKPHVVEQPTITLEGRIAAAQPLKSATWRTSDQGQPQSFKLADDAKTLDVRETIMLQPGPQRIHVAASAGDSETAEAALVVEYHPRLPEIVWVAPRAESIYVDGRDSTAVEAQATVAAGLGSEPFDVVLIHNGREVAAKSQAEGANRSLTAPVTLVPGENRLQFEIKNKWSTARSETTVVYYRRPPQIVDVVAPSAIVETSLITLTVRAMASPQTPLTHVQVGGLNAPLTDAVVEPQGDAKTAWTIVARDVPLVEGPNELEVRARNADGWSATKRVQIKLVKPPPKRPTIEFLAPLADAAVDDPAFKVRAVLRSETKLRKGVLLVDGEPFKEFDPAAQTELAKDKFEWTIELPLTLKPRDNRIELSTINDGGERRTGVTVSFVPRPVRIVVDGFRSREDDTAVLKPRAIEAEQVGFEAAAPTALMQLEGHVSWGAHAAEAAKLKPMLHVRVNGMLQMPIPLNVAAGAEQAAWTVPVRLTLAKENRIHVELLGMEKDAGSRSEAIVDCTKPDDRQRLHLLVVGVNEQNVSDLESRALKVFNAERKEGDRLTSPAFAQGRIYGPLSHHVTRNNILNQLFRIRVAIASSARSNDASDVVMFYYRGAEAVSRDGEFYLLTSESEENPDLETSAVSGSMLSRLFSQSPGAQLFMFDTKRKPLDNAQEAVEEAKPRWPRDSEVAALRYAWLKEGEVPNSARLLVALETATEQVGTLGAVTRNLESRYQDLRRETGASLVYEERVPPGLQALILARP